MVKLRATDPGGCGRVWIPEWQSFKGLRTESGFSNRMYWVQIPVLPPVAPKWV